MMRDEFNAFVCGPRHQVAALRPGLLDGVRIGVKDLIDVAGSITGGGNPDWAAGQSVAITNAWAVQRLLEAGASIGGKTITDELAFSLEGENWHCGTPVNPRCPDCMPGGSSSGSAVAVAAGLVDAALGTDTGGSIRVPAAFCGVAGFRPTHGRISLDGVVPFAPDYDTVGWFASSAALLEKIGAVLLPSESRITPTTPPQLRPVADAFALTDFRCRQMLLAASAGLDLQLSVDVFDGQADRWTACYQTLQNAQIRETLGLWITEHKPHFGPNIAPRFAQIFSIDSVLEEDHRYFRRQIRSRLDDLLANGSVLVLPTAPTAALPLQADVATRGEFYRRALAFGSIAGHAGLPQLTLPAGTVDGRPVGLSFVGARGTDEMLLANATGWADRIEAAFVQMAITDRID